MDSIEEIAGNWPIVPAVLMKRQQSNKETA